MISEVLDDTETTSHDSEVMMNVIAFIPLGVYCRLLKVDWKRSVLLGFGYSLCLEVLQFILMVGITDITDLMTNTAGVAIGAALYALLSRLCRRNDLLDRALTILATVGTAGLVALMTILIVVNQ